MTTEMVPEAMPAIVLGTIVDPHTRQLTQVFAYPRDPQIVYRKANNTRGSLLTPEAQDAWPERGVYDIVLANGRTFTEMHLDALGWWLTSDWTYRPLARAHRSKLKEFLIQLGTGLGNGYPTWDVLVWASKCVTGTLKPIRDGGAQ